MGNGQVVAAGLGQGLGWAGPVAEVGPVARPSVGAVVSIHDEPAVSIGDHAVVSSEI